jgi:uncharacterized protein (TIGR03643 family)
MTFGCLITKITFYNTSTPPYMITNQNISPEEIDRIVAMAWEDRTPFEAIYRQFGLPEKEVIVLMRKEMKPSSFKMWRKRMQGRKTKHEKIGIPTTNFKCSLQREITHNKISKRK